jgi:hypothetical protein
MMLKTIPKDEKKPNIKLTILKCTDKDKQHNSKPSNHNKAIGHV